MAFYFSSETMAFYDTDVFPVASLPANRVEVTEAAYTELMTKQNQGYVIKADNSGNPYAVAQGEATATDMKHSGTIASAVVLGHVKIGDTMQAANDGTLDLKDGAVDSSKIADNAVFERHIFDGAVTEDKLATQAVGTTKIANKAVTTNKLDDEAVTTPKIANANVTTEKIANGAVTEEKLESVKELVADETTLTRSEDANAFTFSVKDGGVSTEKIAALAVTTEKIANQNITNDKLAANAVTTAKIANLNVTNEKLAANSVTREKFDTSLVPAVLPFVDSNNDDLNGTNWSRTWNDGYSQENIGNIGSHVSGRLVDFTIQAEFSIQQGSLTGVNETFEIFVWHGTAPMTQDKIYERRTVNCNENKRYLRERFTFVTAESDNIKINVLPSSLTLNRFMLGNMYLKGFVF